MENYDGLRIEFKEDVRYVVATNIRVIKGIEA